MKVNVFGGGLNVITIHKLHTYLIPLRIPPNWGASKLSQFTGKNWKYTHYCYIIFFHSYWYGAWYFPIGKKNSFTFLYYYLIFFLVPSAWKLTAFVIVIVIIWFKFMKSCFSSNWKCSKTDSLIASQLPREKELHSALHCTAIHCTDHFTALRFVALQRTIQCTPFHGAALNISLHCYSLHNVHILQFSALWRVFGGKIKQHPFIGPEMW